MNYEKKYKEAQKWIESIYSELSHEQRMEAEAFFPELKESEDEKIRKEIMEYVKNTPAAPGGHIEQQVLSRWIAWLEKQGRIESDPRYENLEELLAADDIYQMSMNDEMVREAREKAVNALSGMCIGRLLWLEKQGKQKPVDMIESKFHEGDWVILTAGELSTTLQIVNVDAYKKRYWFNDNSYLPIVDEECLHLWTIQDAKDGDVLVASDGSLFIFAKLKDNSAYYHFSLCKNGSKEISDGKHAWETANSCYPATESQRDTLLKAMTDAGWEFDFEKKELKKIESTNKVEPFDKYEGLTDFERTLADICTGWIGEEIGWKEYIKDNANVLLKIAIKKFNSVQDASFEQKSAWSEEDEHRINRISDFIWKNRKGDTDEIYQQEQDVNWLKSLKDRVRPKQEWSKEDETKMRAALAFIKSEFPKEGNEEIMEDTIEWLKSLRPQKQWKPSEEQIKILNEILNFAANHESPYWNDYIFGTLNNLIRQLKKLIE